MRSHPHQTIRGTMTCKSKTPPCSNPARWVVTLPTGRKVKLCGVHARMYENKEYIPKPPKREQKYAKYIGKAARMRRKRLQERNEDEQQLAEEPHIKFPLP